MDTVVKIENMGVFSTMAKKIKNLQLLGLIFIGSSAAGWYGYYLPKADSFMIHWLIMLVAGCVIYGYKNNILFKMLGNESVPIILSDIIISAACWLIPKIELPHGLSIVIMIVVVAIIQSTILWRYTLPKINTSKNG